MRNETRDVEYLGTGPELGLLDNDAKEVKKEELAKIGLDEDNIIKVASEIAQKEEEAESDEEDSSLTYVAIGAAVAALGYTAHSYWPAITAAVSSAITWTASVAIPAISAFALTSTGMITGMAVLGILLFGAIAYMKMSGKSEPLPPVVDPIPPVVDPIPPVVDPAKQLGDWAKNLKGTQNGLNPSSAATAAATKIQSSYRMHVAKNEVAKLPPVVDPIKENAATKIQSIVRMHVAKKEDASVTTPVIGK